VCQIRGRKNERSAKTIVKIAAAQISCALGDLDANLAKIRDFSSRAKQGGAELIVFPEMADTGYSMPVIKDHARGWSEGAVPELQKIAQNLSLPIISGVSERAGSSIYNAQVVIDATGKIVAKYRKSHLFTDPPLEEHRCFLPGTELISFTMADLGFGLSICYDLRFPEVYRTLATRDKTGVFIISSAWPFPRVEHFRTLAVARAIENQSYVVAANRVGTDDGITFCGSSAIIDPYGVVIAAGSADREEIIEAEASKEVIDSVRNRMAVFAHRRPDLYRL
jgi:predicted amidohydrolase